MQKTNHLLALVTMILSLFTSAPSSAQKFEIGVKAGGTLNGNYLRGHGTDTYLVTPIYGATAGIFGTFLIKQKFNARVEGLISNRGFRSQYSAVGAPAVSLAPVRYPLASRSGSSNSNFFSDAFAQQTVYIDVPVV